MDFVRFQSTLEHDQPPGNFSIPLKALWWDAKGDWARSHALVDELETPEGMAVHAYLHRKVGEDWNADYWYKRAGRKHHRAILEAEFLALVQEIGAN
jgi:hypothetical protein